MRQLISLFIMAIGLFVNSVNATPERKIQIALTHIPKVMEHDNDSAPYNRFIKRLEEEVSFNYSFSYMPSSRANKQLMNQVIDCIFPIIPTETRPIPTQISERINGISAYLFSLGPKVYSGLDQLSGNVVVHKRGYLFGNFIHLHEDVHYFPVTTHEAAIGMLEKKRAAAFIDYLPDLKFVLKPEQFAKLKYDKKKPLVRSYDHFECIVEPRVDVFIKELNQFIKRLQETNGMEGLLGKYYVPVE